MVRNPDAEFAVQRKPPRQTSEPRQPSGALLYFAVLVVIYGLGTALSLYRLWAVPPIVDETGPLPRFSEGRALQHVKALTDLGQRLVGQPEIDEAADYLVGYGRKLVKLAERTRPDLLVQVARETTTGAVASTFLNAEYINKYHNLTNVVLVVSPLTGLRERSVLVNAHFDSTVGTTGASDDASAVGVALEAARTLVANTEVKLAAPVVFLLNGGEEHLCPAAHGFMQQSPWARDLGVFLNLESTGPLGPDFVFQHTGRWPMEALAAAALFPRGSVAAQDFFELGLVPADTDYRMFSAKQLGTLPGIDTAFLLGAGMYHTSRDSIDNIRPGTMQAMGQNVVATVEALGKQLALRRYQNIQEVDVERTVFFDVLGLFMVVYPFSWARLIHLAPLVLLLGLPFVHPGALGSGSSLSIAFGILKETLAALASAASAVLASALMAVFRVTALGGPMAWYGSDGTPYAILVPAALAGALLPYLGRRVDARAAAFGSTLAFSLLAVGLTAAGLGMSFVLAIWAFTGVLTLAELGAPPEKLLQRATINSVWPILVMLPNALALSLYVLQKTSMMGAQGQPDYTFIVADAVAGVVVGLATLSVLGFLIPWIATTCGKSLRRAVLLLFCVSFFFAIQTSLSQEPYTSLAPKKVFIQHLHEHDGAGNIQRSVFAVGAVDSVPVDSLLKGKNALLWQANPSGWEWLTLHPMSDTYIRSVLLQAPKAPADTRLPSLQLLARAAAAGGENDRLELQLVLPGPGYFGCLLLEGPLLGWSMPLSAGMQASQGQPHQRYLRFAGNGAPEDYRIWVEVPSGSALAVKLAAAHAVPNPHIQQFTADFPEWTAPVGITTFASSWRF